MNGAQGCTPMRKGEGYIILPQWWLMGLCNLFCEHIFLPLLTTIPVGLGKSTLRDKKVNIRELVEDTWPLLYWVDFPVQTHSLVQPSSVRCYTEEKTKQNANQELNSKQAYTFQYCYFDSIKKILCS